MIFNPWVLLGALVLVASLCTGSYLKGYKNAENAARAAHALALEQTLAEASERAKNDVKAAVADAEKRQKVRVVFKDKVVTVEKLIRENPTNCVLPDGVRVSINAAIDTANSATTAGHDKLPTPDKTGK